jgi:hypothetical protein
MLQIMGQSYGKAAVAKWLASEAGEQASLLYRHLLLEHGPVKGMA